MPPVLSVISILFIVLLIVPGVFAKRFYFSGVFSKQFGTGDFTDRFITNIFWGFIVQVITYLIFSSYHDFNILHIKGFVFSAYSDLSNNKLPSDFEKYNLWLLLQYVISSVVMAAIVGHFGYRVIRVLKIDINTSIFKFNNDWHYYFSGEILGTKHLFGLKKKVLSTSTDILINTGESRPKMVSGILSTYTLGKNGELETIILTATRRYCEKSKEFKDIPGDFMIIPYSKVLDLNIRYEYPSLNTNGQLKVWLEALLGFLALTSFTLILVLPWFLGFSFWVTISGISLLLLSWLFGLMIIAFFRKNNPKTGWQAKLVAVALFIYCSYKSFEILQMNTIICAVIDSLKQIFN